MSKKEIEAAAQRLSKALKNFKKFFPGLNMDDLLHVMGALIAIAGTSHNPKPLKLPKLKPLKPPKAPNPFSSTPKKSPNVVAGRRAVALGLRPPLKEAIAKVMGNKAMGAADILEALEDRNWVPDAAKPQQYISCTLSSAKDIFERVEGQRGLYKVAASRPALKRDIKKVMGIRSMSAAAVFKALKKQGYVLKAADPQRYVMYLLNVSKEDFERVGRGLYKVRLKKQTAKTLTDKVAQTIKGRKRFAPQEIETELDLKPGQMSGVIVKLQNEGLIQRCSKEEGLWNVN
jgi:hypothetical protein